MKINLENLLRNASQAIDPAKDDGGHAYVLNAVAEHIKQVRSGQATLAEFAALYMMEERSAYAPRWSPPVETES